MSYRKYSESPRNVRLYEHQDNLLDEMLSDREFCSQKGYYSISDVFRNSLSSVGREFEQYKFNKSVSG